MSDGEVLSVSQINRAIGAALEDRFSDAFWVTGEVQGYDRDVFKASQRRWGQVYFELIEKEAGSDTVQAGIKALAWGDVHRQMEAKLKSVGGDVRFQDGLKVKLLCRIDFFWPRAALQLKVLDVDPHFTLGDMERARRELLERLQRAGLMDRNRSIPLTRVPLSIGLITSEGSAAFHDFIEELRASGYAFRVHLFDARMQGADTEGDVAGGVAQLGAMPELDVVALVRGGGSRSDLIWFDKEKIARAVAMCPKPVITGIGHEIDLSVADAVAHTQRKTPTAAAQFLVERVKTFDGEVQEAARLLRERVGERCERESRALTDAARRWRECALGALRARSEALGQGRQRLGSSARRPVVVARERMGGMVARLGMGARSLVRRHRDRLDGFRKECDHQDPRRLLARGYSMLYAGGQLAKSVRSVQVGEFVQARLVDGMITANVLARQEKKE